MKKTYSRANKRFFTSISAAILIGAFAMPAYAQEVDDEPVVASVEKVAKDQIALPQLSDEDKAKLLSSLNTPYRIDKSRDKYRHPLETLEFFGIKPGDKVVEIWPGQGWYSSILAPYLKNNNGQLIAAHFDTSTTSSPLVKSMVDDFANKFANSPETYGEVKIVPFGPRSKDLVEPNSVDAIVTFRNIHNWMSQGWADKAFDDFYKALKPGGLLGIEEHRADEDSPQDPLAADGYVREDYVIDMAKDAGFVLVGKSQINSNPKDTKDYPFGVWTLPPVGRTAPLGKPDNPDFDKTKYMAIGESDRMTLLFAKPLNPPIMVASTNTSEKATKSKFNPVKVVFDAVKNKTSAKGTKTASALPTSDTNKIVQPINDSVKIAASDTATKLNDANNQIKPIETKEVKAETKIAQNTIPVPVPVKVDLKPTLETKTEIKPTQEAAKIQTEPKTEVELPEFSVPEWNGNTKEKTEANKTLEEKDTNELAQDTVEAPNVDTKSVAIAKSGNSKSKKPNTKKAEPVIAEKEKSATKSAQNKGTSAKEKTTTASKNESKTNSKDKKAIASSKDKTTKDDKTKSAQKNTKPEPKTITKGKATDKNTKAKATDKNEKPTTKGKNTKTTEAQKSKTSNSQSKSTKPDPKKTDAKASGSKATNKKSANSPDWVVPNKKKK